MGLDAYEYSLTKGVRLKEGTAREIGEQAAKWGITMSVHAPYYINLASKEEEGRRKSIQYIYSTMEAAEWFGANRVIFHPGSAGTDREAAMETAKITLSQALEKCSSFIAKGIHLCPETMGKQSQLGSLKEVLELCKLDSALMPTIDFGHLHALNQGNIQSCQDYADILDTIENALGKERGRHFHVHFSRIEYTKAGEKKHHTYSETEYGPDFDPLALLLAERELDIIIICESSGMMAEDAAELKRIYQEKLHLFN